MDGSAAIEQNRMALKRIALSLIAMAGLDVDREVRSEGTPRLTLPRHLWLAILRLLRPAEAAARRLIIAASRGITVTLPPPRRQKPKPVPPEQFLRRFGIAVTLPQAEIARAAAAARRPTTSARPRSYCLPLLDPLHIPARGPRSRTVPAHAAPRIMLPGIIAPHRLPPPPSPDDRISAERLGQRLAALTAALDDLQGQARRFARWKARRERGLVRRVSPLKPGRPPGGRLARFDVAEGKRPSRKIREVDEILAHAHALALYALENPIRHDGPTRRNGAKRIFPERRCGRPGAGVRLLKSPARAKGRQQPYACDSPAIGRAAATGLAQCNRNGDTSRWSCYCPRSLPSIEPAQCPTFFLNFAARKFPPACSGRPRAT